jgi:hypothetical protein
LLSVLSAIQKIYQSENAPASNAAAGVRTAGGPAPAYLSAQLANYALALNVFGAGPTTGIGSY